VASRALVRGILRSPSGLVGTVLIALMLLVAFAGPELLRVDPLAPDLGAKLKPPGREHWLGADELGRDVLSRVVYGARLSLTITILGVVGSLVVGAALGLLAGFRGGAWEVVIMQLVEMLMAMPGFLLALLAIAVLGIGVQNLITSLAIQSIPVFARVAHAATLGVREMEFVQAAQSIGATQSRIMVRELAPNIMSPLLVQATLRLATTLLLASSLSFLGLGVQPPQPEWGAMLSGGRAYVTAAPHVILFPGLAIMVTTLGFNLMGDALRDTLDPRYRNE
jgi:peptide/nickel transport system permease protein